MIDHVSIGVRSLEAARAFYAAVLQGLGYSILVEDRDRVGLGKTYPEIWLNERPGMVPDPETGAHLCLRARSVTDVAGFHAAALARGAHDDGPPGPRSYSRADAYAAFVRDPDGNRLEVVTFPA